MAFDPLTMLTITIALALAASLYLAIEWQTVREPSLLYWSAGFALISVGCILALLRSSGLLLVGIWFANGLLISRTGCSSPAWRALPKRGYRLPGCWWW